MQCDKLVQLQAGRGGGQSSWSRTSRKVMRMQMNMRKMMWAQMRMTTRMALLKPAR